MQREYYCPSCGLFFWKDMYETKEDARIERALFTGCPSCNHGILFAVDTYGFFYFAENHKEDIDKKKWSSPKYAPEKAIEIYEKQGMKIYPCCRECSSVTQSEIEGALNNQTDF